PSRPPDAHARPIPAGAVSRPLTAADARRAGAIAPKHLPAPSHARRDSTAVSALEIFGAATALVAGLVGLLLLAARGAASVRIREHADTGLAAPDSYIHFDALLPDDADLLREQHASYRACLHDVRRRHPRPSSEAARRRDVLSDRRRRARDEGVSSRAGAGPHGAGVRRLDRAGLARPRPAAQRPPRLLHQDERVGSQEVRPRVPAADLRQRRRLRGRLLGPLLRRLRGVQVGVRAGRRQVLDPWNGPGAHRGEELLLPALRLPGQVARAVRLAP